MTQLSHFFIFFHRLTKTLIGIGILAVAVMSFEVSAANTPPLTGSDSESILPTNFPQNPQSNQQLVYGGTNNQPPNDSVRCNATTTNGNAGSVGTGANQDTFDESFNYTYDYDTDDPWNTYIDGNERTRGYVSHRDQNGISCRFLGSSLAYTNTPR